MKKSPISAVKERFNSKDELVAAVQKLATEDLWLDRVSSGKGLGRVANSKLLHLHDVLSDAKSRFGSRAKLIDAILSLQKRVKDAGYKTRLEGFSLPRLLDLHGTLSRKETRAQAKAAGKKAPKKAAAPVVAAKPAASAKKAGGSAAHKKAAAKSAAPAKAAPKASSKSGSGKKKN